MKLLASAMLAKLEALAEQGPERTNAFERMLRYEIGQMFSPKGEVR